MNGGVNNGGVVFEIANTGTLAAPVYSDTPTTLVEFAFGASPEASLIADANGNLYGTTMMDGDSADGTVFEVTDSGFVVCSPPAV